MFINLQAIKTFLHSFLTTVFVLAFFLGGTAQVKFSTIVNEKQPGINDYIQVEYTVENARSVEKIEPPSFKNFQLIQGPMQSTGMSYLNGVMSQYKSVSFILQPLVRGRLIVPGAFAVVNGKAIRSDAVAIEVRNEGSGRNNNKNNNSLFPGMSPSFPEEELTVDEEYVLKPGESVADKLKRNLFVKTEINKTTCYEGEPIMATFKLCSRLKSESRVLKRPSLNGFSVYDMIEPEANRPTVENINGKSFNVHIIRQTQLIPLQSGTFNIDPVELDNKVKFLKKANRERSSENRMQQLLDEFMNEGRRGEIEEHSFTLSSKPVVVTVKPLPVLNKPISFNGAVGKFTMKATCKIKTVAAGEALSLQIVINGTGNLTVINPPLVSLPDELEGFEPVTKEKIDKSVYPLSGSKTFNYSFIAKDTGVFKIPAIVFSYFNPSENSYKTESSDSFTIRVTPALRKKGFLNLKLRSGNPTLTDSGGYGISLNLVIGLLAVILVAGLGLYQWKKSRPQVSKETSAKIEKPVLKQEPSQRIDKDHLEGARWHLKQGQSVEFYNEINRSIWKILSGKINIPATELNKYNVITQLQNKGADSGMIFRLQSLFSECEVALYTPVHSATDMEQSLKKAEEVIKDLQASFT